MDEPPVTISREELNALYSELSAGLSDYTKPVRLYCDVDGVIKPEPKSQEDFDKRFPNAVEIDVIPPYSYQNPITLMRGKFWWEAEVVERLAALSHSPHIDFVWLTDWRISAPYVLDDLLGIKSVGFLDWERKFSDYNQVFKSVAIREEQEAAPSKFIWVDDRANQIRGGAPHVFAHEKDDYEWDFDDEGGLIGDEAEAYEDIIPASQYLNVITSATLGLTMEDLDNIEKWVKNNI